MDVSLQTTLKVEACEQLDAKIVELRKMQSPLQKKVDELITRHDAQTKVAVELEQLCTSTAHKTFESVEVRSAAKDDERPAKRAKVNLASENSLGARSAVTYSSFFAERDEFKSGFETLML